MIGHETPLRVVAACDYFCDPLIGGAERVAAEIYSRFDESADIVVVSGVSKRGADPSIQRRSGEQLVVHGSRAIDLSKLIGLQAAFAPWLPFIMWRQVRRGRADVVHASSIHFFGSVVAALISMIARVPLVTTCHVGAMNELGAVSRRIMWVYERSVGRFVLRRSTMVIAVSESVAAHLADLGVPASKVVVIENGVDVDAYVPGDRNSDRIRVAVVGRLIANKGTLETLAAVQEVEAAIDVVFAGDGPLFSKMNDVAAASENISVVGHSDGVEALLGRSDIFIRYSTTEGRSLAILEAMAAGCAVVVSDIAANRALVEDGVTGLVVPLDDIASLTSAIDRLARDPSLRATLGEAARAAVGADSWEIVAASTHKVLRDAADG